MSIEVAERETLGVSDQDLQGDPRWLLVQRILKTETFQRAEQLRKILAYVSRAAILQPDQVLREYDIAFNVLGRRQTFDPAQDNIVRVQFKNLRQRIERYFLEEGKDESMLVSIPKGSYLPVFVLRPEPVAVENAEPLPEPPPVVPTVVLQQQDVPSEPVPRRNRWIVLALIVVAVSGWALLGFNALRSRPSEPQTLGTKRINPAFLAFLSRFQGAVSVEVPDTSEMMIRMITGSEITAEDYARRDFPERQIALVKDPEVRDVLTMLAQRRNTTAGEAKIAIDLIEALRQAGVPSIFRFARDLHVRDFDQASTILIGSRNSNPWVTLFEEQMNFRMVLDPATHMQYFKNFSPLPGEQERYALFQQNDAEHENYAHIAFIPNVHKNGFMLFLDGSDVESVEAAESFLLYGQLTPQVDSLLRRSDVKYFEILLRGRHLAGESDDSLQILSVRTK